MYFHTVSTTVQINSSEVSSKMIWQILVIFLGLVSARERVEPEYLQSLRESGQHEEFARLLGVDVSLVHENTEARSDDGYNFNNVSPLGDILLPEEDERTAIDFVKYSGSKWLYYQIPVAFQQSDFTTDELNSIIYACREWNKLVSRPKLVDYNGHNDYVLVIKGDGCWSYLGRIGGQQALSIGSGCFSNGTVHHEFMHCAGFAHEHCRLDRDDYVEVLWDNIPTNWQSQYQMVDAKDYITIGRYDYNSCMHYPWWAPETYKDAFKVPDGVDKYMLGQDEGLSDEDCYKLETHYDDN